MSDAPGLFDVSFRRRLIAKQIPFTIALELTHRCNLDCVHCYIRDAGSRKRGGELALGKLCRIIDQIAASEATFLTFSGGEPLSHKYFKRIYLYARKKKLALCVNTNATLMDPAMVSFLKRYPPAAIQVSSYGATPEVYEKITGVAGSFRKYVTGLMRLRRAGLRVVLRFVALRDNCHQALPVERFAKHAGIPFRVSFFLMLRRDRDQQKNARIRAQRPTPGQTLRLFKELRIPFILMNPEYSRKRNFIQCCGGYRMGFSIDPAGRFNRCEFIDKPGIDLTRHSLCSAWAGAQDPVDPVMAKKRACGRCAYKDQCPWCPAISYAETGSFYDKVPYLCSLVKAFSRRKR